MIKLFLLRLKDIFILIELKINIHILKVIVLIIALITFLSILL